MSEELKSSPPNSSKDTRAPLENFDLDLLATNQKLTPEERLFQHHAAYQLMMELEKARNEN